jgi:hypothetical protein
VCLRIGHLDVYLRGLLEAHGPCDVLESSIEKHVGYLPAIALNVVLIYVDQQNVWLVSLSRLKLFQELALVLRYFAQLIVLWIAPLSLRTTSCLRH